MAGRAGQRKSIKRLEQDFQKALVATLRLVLVPWKTLIFHCPNGGYRSRVEAGVLKGMGTVSGIPDLMVLYTGDDGVARVLGIECKALGGRLSESQELMHEKFGAIGAPVITLEDGPTATRTAIEFLRNHNVPMRMAED